MTGKSIDSLYFSLMRRNKRTWEDKYYLDTDFGKIRVFDTKEDKPVIINVPDGPNFIEHQSELLQQLSKNYRVVCFEYPGMGFSFPNAKFDYSFDNGARLLLQIMDLLKIEKAALLFSCSNGFYALNAASLDPERFLHVFIAQTPSMAAMTAWTKNAIPNLLQTPIVGQVANLLMDKKFAKIWYKYSLPKTSAHRAPFRAKSIATLNNGGCFCLSSLVQGLKKEQNKPLLVENVKVTLVWGAQDFTHKKTDKSSILQHATSCEIIEFAQCGHFPELEQTSKFVQLVHERMN